MPGPLPPPPAWSEADEQNHDGSFAILNGEAAKQPEQLPRAPKQWGTGSKARVTKVSGARSVPVIDTVDSNAEARKDGQGGINIPASLIVPTGKNNRIGPEYLNSYGPLYEPPAQVSLRTATDQDGENSDGSRWGVRREPGGAIPRVRRHHGMAWTIPVIGPARPLVEDLGWWPGKWDSGLLTSRHRGKLALAALQAAPDVGEVNTMDVDLVEEPRSRIGESEFWGGWHREIRPRLSNASLLSEEECKPYLPTPLCGAPVDQAIGSLKIYLGPIDAQNAENHGEASSHPSLTATLSNQKLACLSRFESHLLSDYWSDKRGFVFNAGGPAKCLDWLPGVDCMTPSMRSNHSHEDKVIVDWLAVGTTCQDPGIGPVDPCCHVKKGGVQIWRIPCPVSRTRLLSEPSLKSPRKTKKKATAGANVTTPGSKENLPILEFFIATEGEVLAMRWCPRGGSGQISIQEEVQEGELPCLGILAASLTNGTILLFSVPSPYQARKEFSIFDDESIHLKLKPLVEYVLPNARCLALEWGSGNVLAAGLSNGHLAIFHPFNHMYKGRPTVYFRVHAGAIRSVSWIRAPSADPNESGFVNESQLEPQKLMTSGVDGTMCMIDLWNIGSPVSLVSYDRGNVGSCCFSSQVGGMIVCDPEYRLKFIILRAKEYGASKGICVQSGLSWDISTSDFHPFLASANADGTCAVTSIVRTLRWRSRCDVWVNTLFKIDMNVKTGELRMLDKLLPELRSLQFRSNRVIASNRTSNKATTSSNADATTNKPVRPEIGEVMPTGTWPMIVGVLSVSWNSNMMRFGEVASGTTCGLVRIDWVEEDLELPSGSEGTYEAYIDSLRDQIEEEVEGQEGVEEEGVEEDDD